MTVGEEASFGSRKGLRREKAGHQEARSSKAFKGAINNSWAEGMRTKVASPRKVGGKKKCEEKQGPR